MEEGTQEKNRKRKAWMTSVGVQVLLLALFYFLVAWREPNPPNPEFGIELNFGLEQSGQGSTPVTSPVQEETNEPEESAPESSELNPEETLEEVTNPDPVETVENPEPDVVQEESTSSSSQVSENPTETDEPAETTSQPTATETAEETNESQGDTGESGDQGDPEGDINEEALYGNPGGGEDGSSLEMSGWEWDSPPDPEDTSDEAGKIVFEITVDSDGYITQVKKILSTVSQQVTLKYQQSIELLTFSKTSSYKPAPSSKGKITFIIRAN